MMKICRIAINKFHLRLSLLLSMLLASLAAAKDLSPLDPTVHNFLESYCISCHGPEEDKGDRVFHEFTTPQADGTLAFDATDEDTLFILEDILDQLNLGEMPPKKKDVAQPATAEIATVIASLTETLLQAEKGDATHQTVMRRLNRREYRNTVRDLLQLGELARDPTAHFPEDEEDHGFRNIGETLNLTEAHLETYLESAETYLNIAFPPSRQPKPQETYTFDQDAWNLPTKEDRTPWMYRLYNAEHHYVDIGAGFKDLSAYLYLATVPKTMQWNEGVRRSGYYELTLNAEAIRRLTHPYDPAMIPCDLDEPMQLGLYVAYSKEGLAAGGTQNRRRIALWDLKDHEKTPYKTTIWLDAGAIPFLNWDNGPGSSDYWMRDICAKYHTDIEFRGKQGAAAWHIVGKDAVPGRAVSDVWQGPVIRLHDFSITGPLTAATYQTEVQQRYDSDRHFEAIPQFLAAAYRRPVSNKEVQPYLAMIEQAKEKLGLSHRQALLSAYKAVLVSPDFLYLRESADRLRATELANRISYFLWSSMPDAELMELTKEGAIFPPETRRQQAQRMLADDRVLTGFVEGFAESWLRLDKLGSMPPDNSKFRPYYSDGLGDAMRDETLYFLSHMIRENLPIGEFLSADWTYLNQPLADHYGIAGISGSTMQRTQLPADSPRRGLLGQASILTLSANGVDTSPVVRGIWVLENILGTPPSPPPPDVEPLDTDTRGAKSIKKQLEKHRTNAACADCHAKIDPYGFPLEYFDAIGGYRETYFHKRVWDRKTYTMFNRPAAAIDGEAQLLSGETFSQPRELIDYLQTKEDQFLSTLIHKLATYAVGRKMTYRDEPELKKIKKRIQNNPEAGFRDLIVEVAGSKLMVGR